MQEEKKENECVVCLLRGLSVGGKETPVGVLDGRYRSKPIHITVCLCDDHNGKKPYLCVTEGGHFRMVGVCIRDCGIHASFSYDTRKRATVPHYVWLPQAKPKHECHDVYWRETHWESFGHTPLPAVAPTCEAFAAAVEAVVHN